MYVCLPNTDSKWYNTVMNYETDQFKRKWISDKFKRY